MPIKTTPADRAAHCGVNALFEDVKGAPAIMNNPLIPKARFENLVTQELSDELLIYNLETNQAYNLNKTSALVWQNCDGVKDIDQIAKTIGTSTNQNVSSEIVWLALDNLKKEGLVNFDAANPISGMSRRDVVKRIGFASMVALPVISTLVAPSAANAQSGIPPAPACLACSKKTATECATLGCTNPGTCYGNNGCATGQGVSILGVNISCTACAAISNPAGTSWISN